MNEELADLWSRAQRSLKSAEEIVDVDPDTCASCAYYAAFYAVTALFLLDEREYSRHAAVETAVHRDLVRTGRWSEELGASYSLLMRARYTGDYGGQDHVARDDALDCIERAKRILRAIATEKSEFQHLE